MGRGFNHLPGKRCRPQGIGDYQPKPSANIGILYTSSKDFVQKNAMHYLNVLRLASMIPMHSSNCGLLITNGGAKRILSPWVGLASKPRSLSAKQRSHAASGFS